MFKNTQTNLNELTNHHYGSFFFLKKKERKKEILQFPPVNGELLWGKHLKSLHT